MTVKPLVLFVDANVLVEFPPLRSLPWRDLFPNGDLALVVCASTFAEYDKFKDTPGGPRQKRERAGKNATALNELLFGDDRTGGPQPIQQGVTVEYDDFAVPHAIYDEHHLDATLGDHRLVAAALAAKARRPDVDVGVVAADGGALRTAKARAVSASARRPVSASRIRPTRSSPRTPT
jgi:hypothetical protein